MYQYKLLDLEIDQRLAKEDIKPDLRVSYNPLIAVGQDALFDDFQIDNYKVGANLTYPLFQRKQRGKIKLNNIKIQDTRLDQSLKKQDLLVKLDLYRNNISQSLIQYDLMQNIVSDYRRMLNGEQRKFNFGESSIFLVNSRESKYLDSQYKRLKLINTILEYRFTYLLTAVALPLLM